MPIHFRSQNAISFGDTNYNQMKKKESTGNPPQSHPLQNLLFKLVAQNYERKNIDSAMITTLNTFVFNLGEDLLRNTPAYTPDALKPCIDIVVAFESNLSDDSPRHTCSLEEILNFFANLALLFDKIITAWKDLEKIVHSELINVVWFLLTGKADENRPAPSDKKVEALNFLVQSNDKQQQTDRLNLQAIVRESFSVACLVPESKHQIKNLFLSFLRHSAQVFNFKAFMEKYLNQCLISNHVIHFRRAIRIYEQIGVTFEERRASLEEFTLKILQSNHNFNFVMEMNDLFGFSKLFNSQSCLKAIVKTIQKVIQKGGNLYPVKVLEEISQLALSDIDSAAFDKLDLRLQQFLARIIEWVVSKGCKKEEEAENKEKLLQQAEQKEEKLIEFVKKLSSKIGMEDIEPESNDQLTKVCNCFSKILKKLIINPKFKSKLTNITLDSFPFLRNEKIANQAVKKFVLDVVPCLLHEFNPTLKEKSSLACAVNLKRAEIEAQSTPQINNKAIQSYFNESYFQLIHPESLNYHFVLCFIFMKHLTEKETVADIITEQIIKDLSKEGKNRSNRNLIINLSLLLKILHPASNSLPVKFKVRELLKHSQTLPQKLDINQIMIVCSKELGILRSSNFEVPKRCLEIQAKLNQQLENYTKDYVTTFYSLIIGISDIIEQSDSSLQDKSSLLVEIKYIRKISFLSETYTLIRCFIEKASEWTENGVIHGKNISIFMLLAKLCLQLKNNAAIQSLEDLDLFIQTLRQYILTINSTFTFELLATLDHFKSNKGQYREEKFYEYLTSKNFIRFYSESIQNQNVTHIILMRTALKLFKKALQAKGQSYEFVEEPIRTLFLIYLYQQSPAEFKFTEKHQEHLKQYLLLLLLSGKVSQSGDLSPIIQKLKANPSVIRQLVLKKHETNYLNDFKTRVPLDFIDMCVRIIVNIFRHYEKQDMVLFRFVIFLIEDDKKGSCSCLNDIIRERLEVQLERSLVELVVKRIHLGLELDEKRKGEFVADSAPLYGLLGRALSKIELLNLVEEIVQIDYYSECDRSAFLLKEIANIFSVVDEKTSSICETIFNYIITLAEIFPGEEKLEIANFICNFFGLSAGNQQGNLQTLEKQVPLQCNNQCNYKCLKCDDKRLLCLGCSLTCHKDHPVCFLSIPPEIKISRCQCREIPNCCKYNKEAGNENKFPQGNRLRGEFPPPMSSYPSYLSGANRQFIERIKYGVPRPKQEDPFGQNRYQYNNFSQEEEYDRMDQELMGNQRYYEMLKDQYVPRMGSRLDRIFDEPHPQAYRIQMEQRGPSQNNPFIREKDKEKEVSKEDQQSEPQFIDESYERDAMKMEIQSSSQVQQNETILKKYALLPKFIDLMINFCSKKATKDKNVANLDLWSPTFTNPSIQKMMAIVLKVSNPGSFHMEVRRENPLNNVSCVLIKRNLASNGRFLIIASGTDLHVYNKQRLLTIASQGKPQGFNPIHRHSVSYEIHSVEVSPADRNMLCATGLHNLALFTINNDGAIGRTQNRFNVNNLYINKIKLTKMGIFVGVQKEIRVLNYTCKQFLTIKAQEANTLIREWAIYEKTAGCQVYFVCPNGNIFFTDVLPSDQGRKEFTGRINDHRKSKNSTGASVFVKDLPDIGKQLFASFKDGYNIVGRLEGDQMENMTDVRLKGIKTEKNIFDTFFIVGHVDLVKLSQIDDVYLVCTAKKYFPPEMAFHQGFLTVVRFKKDGNTDIQILNEESTCESFQVFQVGNKHFFILSLHTDGSLHLNSPTKIPKAVVDEQIKKARENDQGIVGNLNESQTDMIDKIRKALEKQLKLDKITTASHSSSYLFRENSENLRQGTEYTISRLNENQYELKQIAFGKVITGFSLPQFGNVELPTRKIENTFEVGFTLLQSLYFFANGSIRFKYFKNEAQKYTRESINLTNNRILQKIERIERLNEYSEHERMINASMMSNFLNIKEDANQDLVFVGRSFESFKNKVGKFEEYFSIQSDDESSSIEKTALIIKMFLSKGLKEGNFCEKQSILELVNSLTQIIAEVNRKLFKLLKDIIVIAMKVYEKQIDRKMNLYTQENYGLRAATEKRLVHFYTLLRLDIGDEELNELLELLIDIIEEDLALFAFYCAKYAGLLSQIYRRIKRADTDARAEYLVKIYALGYPVLVHCDIACSWVTSAIMQTIYTFVTSKGVRDSLYDGLRLCKFLDLDPALKGLGNKENEAEDIDIGKNAEAGLVQEEGKDPLAEIYMMFSRGEIDEDVMLRMIQDATKIQYEKEQEINQKPPEQNVNIEPELQMEMAEDIQDIDKSSILIFDLIEECTETFEGDSEQILAKIVTLYVVSKIVDAQFYTETDHILERIHKMVQEIDLKWQGEKASAVLNFSCLFNRIITSSEYLKSINYNNSAPYRRIKDEVNNKLGQLQLEKIPKIKSPINLLPRIFRGEKQLPQAHIAYALVNLLLYPCEPSHVLLSLECYWLLPNSRESYAKQKCESSIRDGIVSGNLAKVYEIARQNPEIWQQSPEYLDFIQNWIQKKKNDWELALELLAIFYEN